MLRGAGDHVAIDRPVRDAADQRLAFELRGRSRRLDRRDQVLDAAIELRQRDDLVQQADPQSLCGAEPLCRQEVAPCLPRADRLDDIWTDRCRNQPELRLGQCERRLGHCKGDVACGNETHAAAICRAMNPRDRRLRQRVQRAQHRRQRIGVAQVVLVTEGGHSFHPVEVRTGAEASASTRKNHGAHIRIVIERNEGRGQVGDQRFVESVVDLGTVQRDGRDCVAHRDVTWCNGWRAGMRGGRVRHRAHRSWSLWRLGSVVGHDFRSRSRLIGAIAHRPAAADAGLANIETIGSRTCRPPQAPFASSPGRFSREIPERCIRRAPCRPHMRKRRTVSVRSAD